MPLISKPEFIQLLSSEYLRSINDNKEQYYIGMGNPNADILIVGKEKALDLNNDYYAPIIQHESKLNVEHWIDIFDNYNDLTDSFNPILLQRISPLSGFNPFCPMLFPLTANIVNSSSRHTYRIIETLISRGRINDFSFTENNTFDHCFLTEVNHIPALNNSGFNREISTHRNRDLFISSNPFFQSFRIVVVHVGVNSTKYIGARNSMERLLCVQRLFNGGVNNIPITITLGINRAGRCIEADLYINEVNNSIVVVCNQLSGAAGWTNEALINLKTELGIVV
jgi:hypothetical protein